MHLPLGGCPQRSNPHGRQGEVRLTELAAAHGIDILPPPRS